MRVKKPKIQGVLLKRMKELFTADPGAPMHKESGFITDYARGFLAGYAALRSLINTIPINQATRDAFMKWAVK